MYTTEDLRTAFARAEADKPSYAERDKYAAIYQVYTETEMEETVKAEGYDCLADLVDECDFIYSTGSVAIEDAEPEQGEVEAYLDEYWSKHDRPRGYLNVEFNIKLSHARIPNTEKVEALILRYTGIDATEYRDVMDALYEVYSADFWDQWWWDTVTHELEAFVETTAREMLDIVDWCQAGRSGGWLVLATYFPDSYDELFILREACERLEEAVNTARNHVESDEFWTEGLEVVLEDYQAEQEEQKAAEKTANTVWLLCSGPISGLCGIYRSQEEAERAADPQSEGHTWLRVVGWEMGRSCGAFPV